MNRAPWLLAMLLASCAAPPAPTCAGDGEACPEHLSATLTLAPSVDAPTAEAVLAAVEAWRAADPRVQLTVVAGPCSSRCVELRPEMAEAGHDAEYDPETEEIRFIPGTDPWILRGQALHEVGHFLGLGHSRHIGDAMHPVVPVEAPSAADVSELRRLYD